jgi:hypothetical protein
MHLPEEDRRLMSGSYTIMRRLHERLTNLPVTLAHRDLSQLPEEERRRYERKDGKDTRFFDYVAENIISGYGDNDPGHMGLIHRITGTTGKIITEECGQVPRELTINHSTVVIISDPVDASAYLDDIIARHWDESETELMGDLFRKETAEKGEAAVRRYACNSSITMLRNNLINYTMVMNLFSGDVYVGSPEGIFQGNVSRHRSLDDVQEPIRFIEDERLTMLCYTCAGKYEENRRGTHLRFLPLHEQSWTGSVEELPGGVVWKRPGPAGPMRFVQLVELEGIASPGIGIIAHNGEKIQESLPDIAMAYFSSGGLKAYKLFCDRDHAEHRAGMLLTPVLANSLYKRGMIEQGGVDLLFLNSYDYPSQFRDTTAIMPSSNDAAVTMFTGMVERGYATRIV